MLSTGGDGIREARLEDYVVRGLVDFDDVAYDEQVTGFETEIDTPMASGGESLLMLDLARRTTSALLSAGIVLMAWSACGGGAATMATMMCCAEHHDECEMMRMGEPCCGSDQQAHVVVLEPARADSAPTPSAHRVIAAEAPFLLTPSLLAAPGAASALRLRESPVRSHLAPTVLLI